MTESTMPSETEPTAPPSPTEDPAGPAGPAGQAGQAALGTAHAGHYLQAFARFDERGANGPAWNSAAAAGNLGWLIYRQLWRAAAAFAAALGVWALIAVGLLRWADFLPLGVRAGLALALLLFLLLVPGFYGTALLHTQVRQRLIAAVKRAATIDEACTLLRWQGDVERRRGGWGVAGLLMLGVALGGGLWSWTNTTAPALESPAVEGSLALHAPPATEPLAPAPAPVAPPPLAASAEPPPVPASEPSLAEPPAAVDAALGADTATAAQAAAPAVVAPVPNGAASTASTATLAPPPAVKLVRVKGFGVSVGLFAVRANAERVQAKLRAAGLPVLSDPIESARGPMTRVRVGPFDSREQAQAAAKRVRALGLDARVYAP